MNNVTIKEIDLSDTMGPNAIGMKHYVVYVEGRWVAECPDEKWATVIRNLLQDA